MRTAAYARFSSELQKDTSLEDQLRECFEYAQRHGWQWQEAHVYSDAAISGSSLEGRLGLQTALTAAAAQPRPFDVLLVDDSSRVARDLPDALRVLQRLTFAGVRVIYISQGIDSASEQAETLVAVHGLVDGLYLREISAKVKRGLRGQLSRGLATGSVTYGYRTVPIPDPNRAGERLGARIEVDPAQAEIVRQIFTWFADGVSYTDILRRLHEMRAPGPRGGSARGVWRVASLRRLLANPKYRGLQVWGTTRVERKPGSRTRVARRLPACEWHTLERPDLRIVDDALWQRVQACRHQRGAALDPHRRPGSALLQGRPAAAGHRVSVFTGFLTCGVCGGSVSVVSRHVRKTRTYRYLGCARYAKNGSAGCPNRVTARADDAEAALLAGLRAELVRPETVAYVTARLAAAMQAMVDERPARQEAVKHQLEAIRSKVGYLLAVVESGGASPSVLRALQERETEAALLENESSALAVPVVDHRLAVLPTWVAAELTDIAGLLGDDLARTHAAFERLCLGFTLQPVYDVEPGGRPYLRATGEGQFELLTGNTFPASGAFLP